MDITIILVDVKFGDEMMQIVLCLAYCDQKSDFDISQMYCPVGRLSDKCMAREK